MLFYAEIAKFELFRKYELWEPHFQDIEVCVATKMSKNSAYRIQQQSVSMYDNRGFPTIVVQNKKKRNQ